MKTGPDKVKPIFLRVERSKGEDGGGNRGAKVKYFYECPQCKCHFSTRSKMSVFCSRDCFFQNKKSKPKVRLCKECGEEFEICIKSASYSDRVTCSKKCENLYRAKSIDYSCPSRSIKLSTAAVKQNFAKNLHTPEIHLKAGRAAGNAKVWKPRKGRSALGVPRTVKIFYFESPDGDVYEVPTIRNFVRTNQHLFDSKDLSLSKEKGRSTLDGNMNCRAMKGLQCLVSPSGKLKSWKGWTYAGVKVSGKFTTRHPSSLPKFDKSN